MTADRRNGVYRCNGRVQGGTCPGTSVDLVSADEQVALVVLHRLAAMEPDDPALDAIVTRWLARQDPTLGQERTALVAAVDEARASLSDLEDARYLRGQFSDALGRARFDRLHATLSERLASAEAALADVPDLTPDVTTLLDTALSTEAWEVASLMDRRGILALVLDGVKVRKAPTTGGRFDAARLSFSWSTPPGEEAVLGFEAEDRTEVCRAS